MNLSAYIENCYKSIPRLRKYKFPWEVITDFENFIASEIKELSQDEFNIKNNIALHKTAIIEKGVTIQQNTIIGKNCVVKSGAYLRNGVYLVDDVIIGTHCEIKQSLIFNASRIAHLNYVGNSLIGSDVNLEAGSVLANHFNERKDKNISVKIEGEIINIKTVKFGAVVGDRSRIGANAVLNPGTILKKNTIVGRLEHVDQLK